MIYVVYVRVRVYTYQVRLFTRAFLPDIRLSVGYVLLRYRYRH